MRIGLLRRAAGAPGWRLGRRGRGSTAAFSSDASPPVRAIVLDRIADPNETVDASFFRETIRRHVPPVGGDHELRLETLALSVDPYMRCRFNLDTGAEYVSSFKPDEPITSAGIGRVIGVGQALRGQYREGDLVVEGSFNFPWMSEVSFDLAPTSESGLMLQKIPPALCFVTPPTAVLGAVGHTGLTAFFGVERLVASHGANPGDTVVVSSAAGAVGSVACALLRKKGCNVVALCGSDAKAAWLQVQTIAPPAHRERERQEEQGRGGG